MLPIPTLLIIAASAAGSLAHSHNHIARSITNGTWYHEDPNHPVHELFKRAPSGNRVGSDAWKAQFPPLDLANPTKPPDASKMPQAWLNALNGAIAAKKIPDIPIAISGGVGTQPTYPNGLNPNEPRICSGSAKCKNMELGDVWDAPEGFFATSFDDGPVPSSRKLLAFLASEKIQTTHFLIGVAMVENPAEFQLTIDSGNDLAVHTWTHPQMTTLSNVDVVAQLGYTMDIIYQSTGKVPRYWRPPTGDADNRVRAIALNVFGLRTMFWNSESDDWRLNLAPTDAGHRTGQQLTDTLKGFATGPKSPGRIVLNHETSDAIVQGFIDAFPTIKSNGWQIRPITQLASLGDAGAYRPEGPANILVSGAPTISVSLTSTPDAHSQTSTGGPSPTGTGPATTSSATTGTPGGDTSRPPNSGASTRASLSLLVLVFVISVMSL